MGYADEEKEFSEEEKQFNVRITMLIIENFLALERMKDKGIDGISKQTRHTQFVNGEIKEKRIKELFEKIFIGDYKDLIDGAKRLNIHGIETAIDKKTITSKNVEYIVSTQDKYASLIPTKRFKKGSIKKGLKGNPFRTEKKHQEEYDEAVPVCELIAEEVKMVYEGYKKDKLGIDSNIERLIYYLQNNNSMDGFGGLNLLTQKIENINYKDMESQNDDVLKEFICVLIDKLALASAIIKIKEEKNKH